MRSPDVTVLDPTRGAAGSAACGWPCGPSAGQYRRLFGSHSEGVMSSRVLALWCMDWPAVAAATAAGLPATASVAVTLANRVIACSAAARAAGVRRGLIVLPVRGAARYFGSEEAAAERLVDAVSAAGAECQAGIADQLPTAVFAARAGRIVDPGQDVAFLSDLSIRELATEPSLSGEGRADLADLLWRLGIRTIGQFAQLSRTDVASRFGVDAVVAHRFARGEPERGPSGREPTPELDAVMRCDPPIDRVDAAAFAGRSLACQLHQN